MRQNWPFAVAIVALTVVLAFFGFRQVGSPSDMAKFARDAKRIAGVLRVVDWVHRRFNGTGPRSSWTPLPNELDAAAYEADLLESKDPVTGKPYPYRRVSDTRYELTVVFELSSEEFERRGLRMPDSRWKHDRGPHSIEFKVTDEGTSSYVYDQVGGW